MAMQTKDLDKLTGNKCNCFGAAYFWVCIAIFIFALDRISKILVMHSLPFLRPLNIFPGFNLLFTYNKGAAFSFLNYASGWQEWLFGAIAVIVSIVVITWLIRHKQAHIWTKIAAALILGGTLGNLFDRVFYHYVIDFLDFYFLQWHFPVFNIADSAVCIGAIMLMIEIIRKDRLR